MGGTGTYSFRISSTPFQFHSSGLLVSCKNSFMISSNHGVPWSNKSNVSRSSVSSPEASILSFSHRCGSGVKGANPSVRDSTINKDRGNRLNKLRIVDIDGEIPGTVYLFLKAAISKWVYCPRFCYWAVASRLSRAGTSIGLYFLILAKSRGFLGLAVTINLDFPARYSL